MGDKALDTPTEVVEEVTDEIRAICQKMIDTMYFMRAFGLAANQVGLTHRIFVMDTKYQMDKKRRPINKNPIVMINPVIKETSGLQNGAEGCLSIPGQEIRIARPDTVVVEYTNLEGERVSGVCMGLEARCVLHEVEHLDGKLMIDHVVGEQQKLLIKNKHLQAIKRF